MKLAQILPVLTCSLLASVVLCSQRNHVRTDDWGSFFWKLVALWLFQLQVFQLVGHLFDNVAWLDPIAKYDKLEDRLVLSGEEANQAAGLPLPILTSSESPKFSVVLPCANEGMYAIKTARGVFETTPSHVLHEIIIVDDGSDPPLRTLIEPEEEEKLKIQWVRHEGFTGLINAKLKGGNKASGDILVFLDCHVRPEDSSWWKPIARKIKSNYRRVVVPVVTDLDPDTWQTSRKGADGSTKCCKLTWDVDFKWFYESESEYIPIMIGGLLAMSKRWWLETEGYDEHMLGWGGENIDQSLRIWLCGGEVVQASDSFIGHMWRTNDKPETKARYTLPEGSLYTNRYRAAFWFGPWRQKTEDLEGFRVFGENLTSIPDTSNLQQLKEKLQCKPFAWFLWRFKHLYEDTGLLPPFIFRLKENSTGLCLERQEAGKGAWVLTLAPCHLGGAEANHQQFFHPSNLLGSGGCCSGLRLWNTEECISAIPASGVAARVCDPKGTDSTQLIHLASNGRLEAKTSGKCIGPHPDDVKKIKTSPLPDERVIGLSCFASNDRWEKVEVDYLTSEEDGEGKGSSSPSSLTFKIIDKNTEKCLTALDRTFVLSSCLSPLSKSQIFMSSPLLGGSKLIPLEHGGKMCADLGAEDLLVYPCYPDESKNMNQAFDFEGEVLKSKNGKCVGLEGRPVQLNPCSEGEGGAMVEGQGLVRGEGSGEYFTLKEEKDSEGGPLCLSESAGNKLAMAPCNAASSAQLFFFDTPLLKHKRSQMCLDTNDGTTPILYPCYKKEMLNQKQHWKHEEGKYVQALASKKCLDYKGRPAVRVAMVECGDAEGGWEEYLPLEPVETRLYREAKRDRPDLFATEYSL